MEGADAVTIFGEKIAVRAKVYTIGGFSAHGDQGDLLQWVGHFAQKSRPRIFLVHGEPRSIEGLAAGIRKQWNLDVHIPQWKEILSLEPPAGLAGTVPAYAPEDLRGNMLSLAAELEAEIARLKRHLSEENRPVSDDDVERLEYLRNEMKTLVPE